LDVGVHRLGSIPLFDLFHSEKRLESILLSSETRRPRPMRRPRNRVVGSLSFLAVLLCPCLGVASSPAAASRPVAGKDRSVTGTITDLAGRPVPGAQIELTRTPGGFPFCLCFRDQKQEIYHTSTGPTGRFEVRGLPASWFDLRIDHPDFAPLTWRGIATLDAAGPVDLGRLVLDAGRKLEGIVADGDGRPLANIAIWIRSMGFLWGEILQAEDSAFIRRGPRRVTGADGKFSIPHLEKTGNSTLSLYACRRGSRFMQPLAEPLPQPFRIVLPSLERVPGRVVDPEGRPVSGARVSAGIVLVGWTPIPSDVIDFYDPCPQNSGDAFASTDAAGRFVLEPLAQRVQGVFWVRASAEGFLPYARNEVELGGASGLRNLDIVLQRGASLAGQVRTRAGAPAPGVDISVSCPEVQSRHSTGPDGRYRLDGLPLGGTCHLSAGGGRFDQVEATVEIKAAENHLDLQVVLAETQQVRGRVIGPEGEPIAGAQIDIPGELDGAKSLTAPDGSFLVEKIGKTSDCVLSIWKEGYVARQSKTLKCGEAPMVIRLERALTLTGRLLNLNPEELRTAWIHAIDPSSSSLTPTPRSGVSPADGTYRIGDLGPGEWTVIADAGRRSVEGQVSLRAGERNATLNLSFPNRFPVRGRVSGPGGKGITSASVSFRESDSDSFSGGVGTQADGSFEILLENGSYTVSADGPDESGEGSFSILLPQPVIVVDVPAEGIEIHLEKGLLALHGCIPGLLPSDQAWVEASYQNTTRRYPIKADGCYRFQDLEPGDWSVSARVINHTDHTFLPGCLPGFRQIHHHITLAPGAPETVLDLDLALGNGTLTVDYAGAENLGRLSLRLPFADGETLIEPSCQGYRLREGSYRIQVVNGQGQALVDEPVEVTSDRETVVEIPGSAKPQM
jgi:Carboxypeptidase regulatory-like domain